MDNEIPAHIRKGIENYFDTVKATLIARSYDVLTNREAAIRELGRIYLGIDQEVVKVLKDMKLRREM